MTGRERTEDKVADNTTVLLVVINVSFAIAKSTATMVYNVILLVILVNVAIRQYSQTCLFRTPWDPIKLS